MIMKMKEYIYEYIYWYMFAEQTTPTTAQGTISFCVIEGRKCDLYKNGFP